MFLLILMQQDTVLPHPLQFIRANSKKSHLHPKGARLPPSMNQPYPLITSTAFLRLSEILTFVFLRIISLRSSSRRRRRHSSRSTLSSFAGGTASVLRGSSWCLGGKESLQESPQVLHMCVWQDGGRDRWNMLLSLGRTAAGWPAWEAGVLGIFRRTGFFSVGSPCWAWWCVCVAGVFVGGTHTLVPGATQLSVAASAHVSAGIILVSIYTEGRELNREIPSCRE